jgi:putative transposase
MRTGSERISLAVSRCRKPRSTVSPVPRPPRLEVPGAHYHISSTGCAERTIFRDADDRISFLTILENCIRDQAWMCLQFCVLGTHYHLLLETPNPTLIAGMQKLNYRYARWFNRRYGTSGAVFKSRYHAGLIEGQGHLLEVCRYIALNPVRAGLCSFPEDWRWSSYQGTLGVGRAFPFVASKELLQLFAPDPAAARAQLRRFCEEGLAEATDAEAVPGTCQAPVVGC